MIRRRELRRVNGEVETILGPDHRAGETSHCSLNSWVLGGRQVKIVLCSLSCRGKIFYFATSCPASILIYVLHRQHWTEFSREGESWLWTDTIPPSQSSIGVFTNLTILTSWWCRKSKRRQKRCVVHRWEALLAEVEQIWNMETCLQKIFNMLFVTNHLCSPAVVSPKGIPMNWLILRWDHCVCSQLPCSFPGIGIGWYCDCNSIGMGLKYLGFESHFQLQLTHTLDSHTGARYAIQGPTNCSVYNWTKDRRHQKGIF